MKHIIFIPSGGIVDNLLGYDTKARCDKGLELWRTGEYDFILVTGGICIKGEKEPAGKMMSDYLISNGISPDNILIEEEALDSYENVLYSIPIIVDRLSYEEFSVTVTTQWQHLIRFWIIFRALRKKVNMCPVHYRISLKSWICEWAIIGYTLYDPKGRGRIAIANRTSRRQP